MASFALWPAIAGIVTGVPNAYRLTQADWVIGPRAGEVPWPSWLFLAIKPTDLTPVVLAFFIALAVVILDPASRAWGNEIRAWGLAYGAYVIAATQATSSIIRYGMLLVIWWPFVLNPTMDATPGRTPGAHLGSARRRVHHPVLLARVVLHPSRSARPHADQHQLLLPLIERVRPVRARGRGRSAPS